LSDLTIADGTPAATGSTSISLEFAAGEGGTAPLTWGQRVMWGPILWFGENSNQFNISRPLVLAASVEQGRLLAALRALIEQHQTLRSRYAEHAGEPRQRVLTSGSYELTLVHDQAEPARVIADLAAVLAKPVFDHEAEWPLRVGAAVDLAGRVTAVAFVGSHLAFDGWSFTRLVDLLLDALADDGNRVTAPVAGKPIAAVTDAVMQPLGQAAFQLSPAGQEQSRLSLRHWEQRLSVAPVSMFDFPRAETGELPIERHVLDSTAVTQAAACLAARTRTSFSSVLLCLTALILAAYNGHDTAVLKLVTGNRLDQRSREMIAINAEDAFLVFPVADVDLLTAVRQIHRSAFDSYRRSQYDPFQLHPLIAEAGRRRGATFDLSAYFNNGHRGSDWPSAGPDLEPTALGRLRRDSRYSRMDSLPKSDMKYYVAAANQGAGLCRLVVMVDTAFLPGALGEVILKGIETLLCDAVAEEVQVSEIPSRIGMVPAGRGTDWVRTSVGWVRPDEVVELVRAAAGGAETAVFARRHPDRRDIWELMAYVVGTVRPEDLHRRVLDALSARPGAAAPAEYVVCESAPRWGSGLDDWQKVTVVARGSGRLA
jgi:hypothetical protein